jgi:hypothetical protein
MSGNIVGALPVGVQSHRNADAPYWPTENCHNWKEVWVHPVGRWIWLMRDLSGPAELDGSSPAPVQFREISTGQISRATPDAKTGSFHATLPEGQYELTAGSQKRLLTALPGETYSVQLAAGKNLDVRLSSETAVGGGVTIRAALSGSGEHTVVLRADNLVTDGSSRKITLKPGVPETVEWHARPAVADAPWVAVVVPDNEISNRREVTGK